MRLRQPVLVEWVDSRQPVTAWRFLSQITPQGAVRCLSVGWLVARDAETLLLAANLGDTAGETPQACGVMEIPRRAVLRVRRLGPTGHRPRLRAGLRQHRTLRCASAT